MRCVRGFHHLGSRGFTFPSECSHPVSIETSRLVHGSKMQWCGKSYSASTSSETVEAKKTQRRVTKDERRSMVENYVNKYREMNEGKFPTVTDVQKNAGGSYYFVRQIVQELICNSKTSSTKPHHAAFLENISVNKDEISGKVSQTKKIEELVNPISKVHMNFESKKVSHTSISVQASLPDETQSIPEVKDDRLKGPEIDIKKDTVHGDRVKFDGSHPMSESQKPTGSAISGRESHSAPSLWQNLRSFANEILGIWKRS